jgi:NAD(P)H dehydrogenase (quinone)
MYTTTLGPALEHGAIIGSFGDGKISGATRADLAAAAAAVLLAGNDEAGKIYELGGTAFTMSDLAAEVSRLTGNPITYQDMPVDQYAKVLTGAGLPPAFAELLADTSLAATRGDWYTDSTDLPQLIGRPSTPLATAVADALKAGPADTFDLRG